MYFNICDPGHISVRDVCICSDHMRKWWNLCYLAATLTYIRAWAHETPWISTIYVCVWNGSETLPPWAKPNSHCDKSGNHTHTVTKAEGTPDDLPLSRRSGSSSSRRQDNSYYNWDQNRCHQSDVNVNGATLGKCWGNVGRLLGLSPERLFSSLLSDPALAAVRLTMLTALGRLRRRFLEILEGLPMLQQRRL